MKIKINEKEFYINPMKLSKTISIHTGNELIEYEANMRLPNLFYHELFLKILESSKDQGIHIVDDEGNEKLWKIFNKSYHYQGNDPNTIYDYSLEIKEMEDMTIESIDIEDINLKPYEYSEEIDKDALIINMKVKIDKETHTRLKPFIKKRNYFNVVRHGIQEETRKMRFGRPLWSDYENGIKAEFVLVEEIFDKDDDKFRGINEPDNTNLKKELSRVSIILENLLTKIANNNILSKKDIDELTNPTEEELWEKKYLFNKVEDIDKF